MIIEHGRDVAMRTFRMKNKDGTEYWQSRFSFRMPSGAWWHGVTVRPHKTQEEAQQDALTLARAKQVAS